MLALGLVSPTLAAGNNLDLAREMIFARRWEDARGYIEQELQARPSSWLAHKLKGDYVFQGQGRPRDSLLLYKKAWDLSGGRRRLLTGVEEENHAELGQRLNQIYLELAREAQSKSGAVAMVRTLERVIASERFFSIPLVVELCRTYQQSGNLDRVELLLSRLPPRDEELDFRTGEAHWGHVDLWASRAAAASRNWVLAYAQLKKARSQGVPGLDEDFDLIVRNIRSQIDQPVQEAQTAYRERQYPRVIGLLNPIKDAIPADLSELRRLVESLIENAQLNVEYEAVSLRAEDLQKEGKIEEAVALLDTTLSKEPTDDVRVQTLRKSLELKRERLGRDRAEARRTQAQSEREREAAYLTAVEAARTLKGENRFRESLENYRKALELKADPVLERELAAVEAKAKLEERLDQGEALLARQLHARVIQELEVLEKEDDTFQRYRVQKTLALSCFALKQFDKAERHALKALEQREDVELLNELATYYEEKADTRLDRKTALGYLERLLQIAPDDPDYLARADKLRWAINRMGYFALAGLLLTYVLGYFLVKKYPELVKRTALSDLERFVGKGQYAKAVELYPKLASARLSPREEIAIHTQFQRAFFEVGQYGRAINEAQRVLKVFPENKQVRMLHARCLYRLKNISPENLQYYFDLLEAEADNKELLVYVGQYCARKKITTAGTLGILRTLADITPEDDALRRMLIKGYLKENDRGPRAIKLYEIEKNKNPENIEVRVALAEYYLKKGDLSRTIEECEELINLELNNRKVHQVLVEAYRKLGRLPELVATYRSILDSDPRNSVIQGLLRELAPAETALEAGSAGTGEAGASEAMETSGIRLMDSSGELVSCPKCGRPAEVGSYFCACGQPL